MSFSVIIPSRTASNLVPCVEAVFRNEPTAPYVDGIRNEDAAQILVVDDGIDWPVGWNLRPWLKIICGEKPFIFARNCNAGIKACEDDVILLNDDAMLETPFGFHELQAASEAHPEFGVISAVTNVTGNPRQQPKDSGLREDPRMVCFVCVYIPRRTIERVGLLDEDFTGYGFEDDAYCLRVRRAGLKIGIFDDCFVDHGSLKSTFRSATYPGGGFKQNEAIFRAKFGAGNHEL